MQTYNMKLPKISTTSTFAVNRMMMPFTIFLAIVAGFQSVEASNTKTVGNIVDNNFAFGRPISTGSGARRKRLPGSQLKGGRGLLTIEELEKEFEAASFGDLFFDRALQESSMSYSMSYDYFSMSYSYYETARTTNQPTSPAETTDGGDVPIVDDAPGPVVPAPDDGTPSVGDQPETLNTFTCDGNGDIALNLNTMPASDATSVDMVYSYSFETTGGDPNTVSLVEAAIVGTMVSTLLDCSAPSGGAGRALAPTTSVSTTFSNVLSQDPCPSSADGSSCYAVESFINFKLEGGPTAEEARIKALSSVKNAMENGVYAVPSVTKITYLAPDVDDGNDSTQDSGSEIPPSDGMSNMTKVGIGLMSVGGVVLVAALMRRRTLKARRHTEHVRLKDFDGSRDGEASLLTMENSEDSPASTPSRNGVAGDDLHPQLEHEMA